MCGRYQLNVEGAPEELERILEEINRRYDGKDELARMKTGEIAPTDVTPVLANSRRGEVRPFLMKWGFAGAKSLVINARWETVLERPMFEESARLRRCLVPASGYFEWENTPDGKTKYAISRGNMIYLAGLYRLEGAGKLPSFVILTRPAAPGVAFIHDRMPVIIPSEAAGEWLGLGGGVPDALALSEERVEARRAPGLCPGPACCRQTD